MRPFRPYDTVELATSGRAACRLCKSKITKGSPRACIHNLHHSGRYWGKHYYHTECMKTKSQGIALWKRANLSPDLLQREKAGSDLSRMDLLDLGVVNSNHQKSKSEATLKKRSKLREKLRKLRQSLAYRFGFGQDVYMVFNNKTLDALVLDMPTNSTELLKVHGFAQKRTDSLGRFILPILREYQGKDTNANNEIARSSAATTIPSLEDEDDDNDDEVIFESHETIEDIVNRLFEEARERGEVISL